MSADPDLAGGRLTIDLDALVSNWRHLAACAGDAECAAVVKANAYGCGIEPVVRALSAAGCTTFFVAVPEEGLRVKTAAPDATCFVLNGLFATAAPTYLKAGLTPILGSVPEVMTWVETAKAAAVPLPCAVHMDSGMTRLGMSLAELQQISSNSDIMDHLDVRLFMTHYACADDIGHAQTLRQRDNFLEGAKLFPGVPRSAANSAADLQKDGHEFELARPGVALYGGEALNDVPNPMKPVVKLEGRIVQIRQAYAGDAVGYGGAEVLKRDSRIAYISVGYADGYHRGSSHMGVPMRQVSPPAQAAFKGQRINGVGRISMDLSGFDVTDIPEDQIAAGDWIELFGDAIAVDDVARAAGTIGYELLTGLGNRYARVYVGGDGQS
ncbi:MAG: alanine racemase [Hyphomicrobiales bacterium]|nr:alanine racemase [Hyphomicrobiales bacterium]